MNIGISPPIPFRPLRVDSLFVYMGKDVQGNQRILAATDELSGAPVMMIFNSKERADLFLNTAHACAASMGSNLYLREYKAVGAETLVGS